MEFNLQKLLYRRQFILGPKFIDSFPFWKKIEIRSTICLTVHPDLQALQIKRGQRSITLLGYILDPTNPDHNDKTILQGLLINLATSHNFDAFIENTYCYGGRWILVVDDAKAVRAFTDAAGYRTLFYTTISNFSPMWCASQPGILAEMLSLEKDQEALEFLDSPQCKHSGNNEYFFPGESSSYKEIRHLLPNHYLNVTRGYSKRYWPKDYLPTISLDECVEKCSILLTKIMQSAINRFPLVMTITAGRDTRLVLAASRKIKDQVDYYSWMYWDMSEIHSDIVIPAKLLSKLGLHHNIIKCPSVMNKDLATIYHNNVTAAHEVYGVIAQGLYEQLPQRVVHVKGNAIPIAKCGLRSTLNSWGLGETEITSEILARLTNVDGDDFAARHYERWISGVGYSYNLDILDLFWWENREANWQAISQLELDIAQEVFVPFNCRSLLADMLSLDQSYRKPPEYRLHKELIKNMWPELLTVPINPRSEAKWSLRKSIDRGKAKVKSRLKGIL
jgi:hypothetical protein